MGMGRLAASPSKRIAIFRSRRAWELAQKACRLIMADFFDFQSGPSYRLLACLMASAPFFRLFTSLDRRLVSRAAKLAGRGAGPVC